jgi:hypothetical protein
MVREILAGLTLLVTAAAAVAQLARDEARGAVGMDATFAETVARIRNDDPIQEDDLARFGCYELALLRNTVYARHGRPFQKREFRDYFLRQRWYRPKRGFSEEKDLTFVDAANIRRIQGAEVPCRTGR